VPVLGPDVTTSAVAQSEVHQAPYRQLNYRVKEIRLCRIAPALAWDDPIVCTLETRRLKAKGTFKCLSYVWGPKIFKTILLDGLNHEVTQNLYEVLLHLRSWLKPGQAVWIDAICVDQNSKSEKTQQVPMMGRIYRKASEVIVWLGPNPVDRTGDTVAGASPNEADIKEVFEFFQELADDGHFHDLRYFSNCGGSCPSTPKAPKGSWEGLMKTLEAIMRAPWFSRTWVIQEIVLARRAVAMYGQHTIPWITIETAWRNWNNHLNITRCCHFCILGLDQSHKGDPETLAKYRDSVMDFWNAKQFWRKGKDLLTALHVFRRKEVSEPKDKIFGLLGLQRGAKAILIKPEYAEWYTLSEAYTDFAIQLNRKHGKLTTLHLDLHQLLPDLPSWVPDWTSPLTPFTVPPTFMLCRLSSLKLYGPTAGLETPRWSVFGKHRLDLHGIRIGTIERLSSVCKLETETERAFGPLEQLTEWMTFLRSCVKEGRLSGPMAVESFHRTIFADVFHNGAESVTRRSPGDVVAWRQHWDGMSEQLRDYGPRTVVSLGPWENSHFIACLGRALFVTSTGYIGLCPERAQVGDSVWVLQDCPAPVFLRSLEGEKGAALNTYKALGDGYVDGFMDGEAIDRGLGSESVSIV